MKSIQEFDPNFMYVFNKNLVTKPHGKIEYYKKINIQPNTLKIYTQKICSFGFGISTVAS